MQTILGISYMMETLPDCKFIYFKGRLRVQTDALREELLPADTNDLDCRMAEGRSCFKSGQNHYFN